jgi:hypothetical protein
MKLWRGQPDNSKPSRPATAQRWLFFAGASYLLALWDYFSPPKHTGRWSGLLDFGVWMFGKNGEVIVQVLVGTACLLAAIVNFRE